VWELTNEHVGSGTMAGKTISILYEQNMMAQVESLVKTEDLW